MSHARRYVNPGMVPSDVSVQQPTTEIPIAATNHGVPQQQQSQPQQQTKGVYTQKPISAPIFPWENLELLNPPTPSNVIPLPSYFRTVSSVFPSTKECYLQCKIPFGVVVSPAIVSGAPLIDYSNTDINRCSACSAYLCTHCKTMVTNNQPSWSCAICGKANAFPSYIYNNQMNFQNLPELSSPVYDVLAPPSFTRCPARAAFIIIVDMSYNAFMMGFTQHFLASLKASIDSIPQTARISLIAMSNTISIFDLQNSREIVIPDLNDAYLNVSQDSVFPVLSECKSVLNDAIDLLISRTPTTAGGHCILSALIIAERIATNIGAIVIVGFAKLPTSGPFPLKPRTAESEADLLKLPQDGSGKGYREAAFRLNRQGCSVHMFCASDEFCDLSTVAVPAGLTCGEVNFYSKFDEYHRAKMHADLFATLTNEYCWDSSLRLRCSPGIKLVRPHTNCTLKQNDLISFPIIAREDAIAFELAVESTIVQHEALFQLALVYSTSTGVRMIRVFTFALPTSADANAVCATIDEATLISLSTRRAMTAILSNGPMEAALSIRKELAQIFSRGTNFKSFVYLIHSLLSNTVMRPIHPLGTDGRMATVIKLRAISIIDLLLFLYPRMFSVDGQNKKNGNQNRNDGGNNNTATTNRNNYKTLPLCGSSFAEGSVFLFHTVDRIYVWVSQNAPKEYLQAAFGVESLQELPIEVPTIESQENKGIQQLLNNCWTLSGRYLQTEIIGQGSPREALFADILVDESKVCGSSLLDMCREFRFIA